MANKKERRTFTSDIRMQTEDLRNPRVMVVTDNPDDTFPGYVAIGMFRRGLPGRRRYWLKTEDAKALGEFLIDLTKDKANRRIEHSPTCELGDGYPEARCTCVKPYPIRH